MLATWCVLVQNSVMATDSRIYENRAEVVSLNLVMGQENTPRWEHVFNVPYLDLGLDGVTLSRTDLDRHHGATRQVRKYQAGAWAGRIVRNERQVSIATLEDLKAIADFLGITEMIENDQGVDVFMSQAMAVNVVISGAIDLKDYLGPGSKLLCGEPETGAIVDISEAHLPCSKPATDISGKLDLDLSIIKKRFKEVAADKRGFVGSVYSPGRLALGDAVAIQLPIDHRVDRPKWQQPE